MRDMLLPSVPLDVSAVPQSHHGQTRVSVSPLLNQFLQPVSPQVQSSGFSLLSTSLVRVCPLFHVNTVTTGSSSSSITHLEYQSAPYFPKFTLVSLNHAPHPAICLQWLPIALQVNSRLVAMVQKAPCVLTPAFFCSLILSTSCVDGDPSVLQMTHARLWTLACTAFSA